MYTIDNLRQQFRRLLNSRDATQHRHFCEHELPRYVAALAPPAPAVSKATVPMLRFDGSLPRLPYQQQKNKLSGNRFHWGQLKLFASELDFLSLAIRAHGSDLFDRLDCVVYIGAADGRHIPIIIQNFPKVVWHLYDPAPFHRDLREYAASVDNVVLYNQYFTDVEAASYSGQTTLLISDVRRMGDDDSQSIRLKRDDHELQADWVRIMSPIATMLKFSPPYAVDGVGETMRYFDGVVATQAYAPDNSTESRLMFSGVPDYVDYDTAAIEEMHCRINRVERESHIAGDAMLFKITVEDGVVPLKIRSSVIAQPTFVAHDAWRLTQILLMCALTKHAIVGGSFDGLGAINCDNYMRLRRSQIPANPVPVFEIMRGLMDEFLRTHGSFERHIFANKLRRSNDD